MRGREPPHRIVFEPTVMINRILIRIKVVQLLYSYLLIEKHFMLESQPTPPTKEKRFAYGLYLDLLVLMVRIAERVEKRGGVRPLYDNRFVANVIADDKIKSLLARYRTEPFQLDSVVDGLVERIKESGVYKLYAKKAEREPADDVAVWREIFSQIIFKNPELAAVESRRENYSLRGVERANGMLETTFTNFSSSQGHLSDALKELRVSLDKARELYFRLLSLPVELTALRDRQIDDNRHKYLATPEDLNPNMRFVENQLVARLADTQEISAYIQKNDIDWLRDDEPMMRLLLRDIMRSDIYREYMEFPASDLHTDSELWRNLYKHVIFRSVDFLEALEDKSVFWNDDMEIIGTFALKTLKRYEDDDVEQAILPMFKDDEDAKFGAELFSYVIRNKDFYRRYIDSLVDSRSWDSDRLAFMDVVIMLTAMAELLNFPGIPTSVTINEYIEMAKSYSTPKSGVFVHGMLGAIVNRLREEGAIVKE